MDLVVLSGLQGAGKTTFYFARFGDTHAHVSRDLLRNHRDPRRRQRSLVEQAAREGRSVVVDNTNARREDRAELVALARALGMTPVLYWFPPDVQGSLARNSARAGRARVPAVAVLATAKRLAPPEPGEGFARAYEVSPDAGAFAVSPRPDLAPRGPGPG
jgi:predicted kinase